MSENTEKESQQPDIDQNIGGQEKQVAESKTNTHDQKKSFGQGCLFIGVYLLSLLCLAALVFFASRFYYTGAMPWDGLINQNSVMSGQDIRRIQQTYQTIQSSYIEEVDQDALVKGAINGMTQAIDDPYSQFLQGEEASQLESTIEGSFDGIGAEIMQKDGKIQVVSPIKDSPAEKAGIQANDVILAVDGQSLEGKTAQEAVALIRGEAGTDVVLTLERQGQSQEVTVTRGEIPIQTVHSEMIAGTDVGRIQITNFSSPTYDEVVEAVKTLRQEGAKRFVLDVRSNPGGLLPSVLQIANMFLDDGDTILQIQEKSGQAQKMLASNEDYGDFKVDEPVAVLIDQGSASASEILAAALQESVGAPIVGSPSFGKGTVQTVIPMDESAELKLTVAKWLTPNGNWINEKGVQPDEEVKLPDYAQLTLIDTSQRYQLGQESKEIENIKAILAALGYLSDDQVNELYDQTTSQAVENLQNDAGLEVTGEINSDTANWMIQAIQEKIQANDKPLERAVDILEE
ncbi:S41 family peptidase [Aerococcus kribbianus]|uniref:S41 family peptidase n=1 Tax=Aerococcus kribbianus TaxID=2999064 RepID=A0A9X3FND3_9LACT|nr:MULTISPECIES: S41 family peptidase [unclassified Aerococcus]MCZ0716791.1 S41 family peptidase [Aerococcus sp. YH-aer221]MCZ0725079.1 S41 family peptidase [Aerococcus sp. YH-aer222]